MAMNTASVMLTVCVLNLHHRHDNRPVPAWVRTLIIHGLSRVVCMRPNPDHSVYSLTARRYSEDARKRASIVKHPSSIANTDKDGYSVSYAAQKFSNNVHLQNSVKRKGAKQENHNSYHHNNSQPDDKCGPTTCLNEESEEDYYMLRDNLEEWRDLARIMDRLFFWFTFLLMVGFCVTATVVAIFW